MTTLRPFRASRYRYCRAGFAKHLRHRVWFSRRKRPLTKARNIAKTSWAYPHNNARDLCYA